MPYPYESRGKIIKVTGGLYTVKLAADGSPLSDRVVCCKARGSFRHVGAKPLVGDNVTVSYERETAPAAVPAPSGGQACPASVWITDVLPRKNSLIRPPLANLDRMLVVMSAAAPAPDVPTTDKLLCILAYNHISPIIVIGKAELAPSTAETLRGIYEKAGYPVYVLSCRTGAGVAELAAALPALTRGTVTAAAGASGVGKSTLLNTLFPSLSLVTGDISEKIERGKNTTRHTELFPLDGGGYIADTAGFSLLDFVHFDFFGLDNLFDTFPEFAPYAGTCRYTDCTHLKEEGCAIVDAVRTGRIAPSRHRAYCDLYAILKEKHTWDK